MVVKNEKVVEAKDKKVTAPKTVTKAVLEKENDELKKEMSEMKIMMEQMKQFMTAQQSQPKIEKEVKVVEQTIDDYEDIENIEITKLINVTSLFDGDLTLFGLNNTPYKFNGFGVTRPLTYENIIQIVGNYNKWARDGMFYIHNTKAIKLLGLEYDYKNVLTKDQIVNLIDREEDEIRKLLLNASEEQQETIRYIVAKGMNNNDSRYLNRNKIEAISDTLKIDMSDYADILRWK